MVSINSCACRDRSRGQTDMTIGNGDVRGPFTSESFASVACYYGNADMGSDAEAAK